ncbi:hypothetical protein [Sphingobacterium corticibacter]|uniref:Uncharacterized protein n=1 Tax=Sphingobacterium corticibacter TaxID=2171749 RepID=A0A2T8HFP8_9SPHI|nr:hypothetical protein [Sphingobacterium corticibacter]PVH24268.1 hypothetical protein DC487_14375 [Sphingobacterium corticibacter]
MNQELLAKYLNNTCTADERKQVEQWLAPKEFSEETSIDHSICDLQHKNRMWQDIQSSIQVSRKRRPYALICSRYAAAAILLLLFTFQKNDTLFVGDAYRHALNVEKIEQTSHIDIPFKLQDIHRISNPGSRAIQIQTYSHAKQQTLEQNKTYLHIRLAQDPGVIGDQVLLLSKEQLQMLPDSPLVAHLASLIDMESLEAKNTFYL